MRNYKTKLKNAAKAKKAIEERVKKRLSKVKALLVAEIKKTVSIQAVPTIRYRTKDGHLAYRTTTPARVGEPPRRLSGNLRRSVTGRVDVKKYQVFLTAWMKSRKGFPYPKYHEQKGFGRGSGRHPFISPTVRRLHARIKRILEKGR